MIADEPRFEDGGFEIGDVPLGADSIVDGGDEAGGIIGAEEDGTDERTAEKGRDAIGFAGSLAENLVGSGVEWIGIFRVVFVPLADNCELVEVKFELGDEFAEMACVPEADGEAGGVGGKAEDVVRHVGFAQVVMAKGAPGDFFKDGPDALFGLFVFGIRRAGHHPWEQGLSWGWLCGPENGGGVANTEAAFLSGEEPVEGIAIGEGSGFGDRGISSLADVTAVFFAERFIGSFIKGNEKRAFGIKRFDLGFVEPGDGGNLSCD